jgi:betaine-aldehyde dehydrogenase
MSDTLKAPDIGFKPKGLYIGGRWEAPAEGKSFENINPSTKQSLGSIPAASAADVDRAVQAAKKAFRDWSNTPPKDRAAAMVKFAERIEQHADELGLMDAIDSGNAVSGMRGDVKWTADTFRFFAGLITEIKGETSTQGPRHLNLTIRQPYGVVAKINPFNHPFRFCAEKAAAPLAAGNCVVIKGSEQAPLSSLRLAELADGIFPAGVVNVLTGDGAVGSAMVRHPDVHRIGFVGSVPTGKLIAREAADGLKKVTFELGGKNPIIIFPDADPSKAAAAAIKGMNMNRQGQSCSSTSRVMVHASLHEPVLKELKKQAEALSIGAPWVESNELGPIVSQRQYDRIMGYIDSAKSEGASLVTGGGQPSDSKLHNGFFIAPTDLRPGDVGLPVGRLRATAQAGQRTRIRPDRVDCHQQPRASDGNRPPRRGRLRLDQLERPLSRRALRRLEIERHRPGRVLRRAAQLHANQEHQHALVIGAPCNKDPNNKNQNDTN